MMLHKLLYYNYKAQSKNICRHSFSVGSPGLPPVDVVGNSWGWGWPPARWGLACWNPTVVERAPLDPTQSFRLKPKEDPQPGNTNIIQMLF